MKAIVLTKWDMKVVDCLIDIGEEFVRETKFPITFCRKRVRARLSDAFFSEDSDIIVAVDDDGNYGGGAIVHACDDYQEEYFGYVEKFFISPRFRAQGTGRLVAAKMAEWFDDHDCLFSFATSTANIGASGLFTNLMAKYGYSDQGATLSRGYKHGKV